MIIDVHAHAFPDSLASRAVPALEEEGHIEAVLDGTVSSLLESMDTAGVDASVVASIATKPSQFEPILSWSHTIASSRIIPFPSVHPGDPKAIEQVHAIAAEGFLGVKLHPYYQRFSLDEPRVVDLAGAISREGLVLLLHTGYDLAFPRDPIVTPRMVAELIRRLPELKLIAPHFGGWEDWDEAERYVIGTDVYIDTSYSIPMLGAERARRFLMAHRGDRILFGSDSPWSDQAEDLAALSALGLDPEVYAKLTGANAAALLGLG